MPSLSDLYHSHAPARPTLQPTGISPDLLAQLLRNGPPPTLDRYAGRGSANTLPPHREGPMPRDPRYDAPPEQPRADAAASLGGPLEEQIPPAAQSQPPVSSDLHAQVAELAKLDPELLDHFIRKGIESELSQVPGFRSGIVPAGSPRPRMGLEDVNPETDMGSAMHEALGQSGIDREMPEGMGFGKQDPQSEMGRFGLPSHSDLEAMGLPGVARDYLTEEELKSLPGILSKLNAKPAEQSTGYYHKPPGGYPSANEVRDMQEAGAHVLSKYKGDGTEPTFSDPEAAKLSTARGEQLGNIKSSRTAAEAEQLLADEKLDLRGSVKNERASDLAMRSSYNRPARERMAQASGAKNLDDMRVLNERSGRPTNEMVELPKTAARTFEPSRERIESGQYQRSNSVNPKHLHEGQPPSPFEIDALQKEGLRSTEAIDRARARKGQPDLTETFAKGKASSIANERRAGYHRFYNKDTSLDYDGPQVDPVRITSKLADPDRVPQTRHMSRNPDVDTRQPKGAALAQRSQEAMDPSRDQWDPRGLQNTGDAVIQKYRAKTGRQLEDYMSAHDIEAAGGQPPHIPQEGYTRGEMEALYAPTQSYRGGRNSGAGGNNRTGLDAAGRAGPPEHPMLKRQRENKQNRESRKGKFQEYLEKRANGGTS